MTETLDAGPRSRSRAGDGERPGPAKSHKQVRARVEHVFARMKTWKILRDCRLQVECAIEVERGLGHIY